MLRGSAFADRLTGGVGPNTLEAMDGADTLDGGNGPDRLIGGLGLDRLTGGAGADAFVWKRTTESPAATPDLVLDFSQAEGDRIDLLDIDARRGTAGDQAFAWADTGAFVGGGIGSVRYRHAAGETIVEVDTGDRIADLAIRIVGLFVLGPGDFVL
jgi:Ca2+-binding RTX toxin-like protein